MKRYTFIHDGNWCINGVNAQVTGDRHGNYWGPAIDKLAAYENTDVGPVAVETALQLIEKIAFGKLGEIIEAHKDGRAPILPCKLGDEVWGICRHGRSKMAKAGIVTEMYYVEGMKLVVAARYVCRGIFGETVFLTKEETEAALAARKGEE